MQISKWPLLHLPPACAGGFFYDQNYPARHHLRSPAAAAKVIENTLRDLNFALVNELAINFRQVLVPTGVLLVLNGVVPRQLGALRL
jgi:UDP-N-acetyl-D-mannosaminuronate dehydrogenase